MSEYIVTNTELESLANHIRAKGNSSAKMIWPEGYEGAVDAIQTGVNKPEQEKTVSATQNGDVIVLPDQGKTLYKATVKVNVPSDKKPEIAGQGTITQNGQKKYVPSPGEVFSSFTVTVNTPSPKLEENYIKTYTQNGSYPIVPSKGKVISGGSITINTPLKKEEQQKTVTIDSNRTTIIEPDQDKVLNKVTVEVNVPNNQKQEEQGREIITRNGVQTFTPSAGKVFSNFTADVQVPAPKIKLQNKTVSPTENEQLISKDSGFDGLNVVTVKPIPTLYIGTGVPRQSNIDISKLPEISAQSGYYGSTVKTTLQSKAAAIIVPSTVDQSIGKGVYLTGDQIIKGDINLKGSNIISGVSIFGIDGKIVTQDYYTGTSAPSDTQGRNGDLYLQIEGGV